MRKHFVVVAVTLAAGFALSAGARAQQGSTPNPAKPSGATQTPKSASLPSKPSPSTSTAAPQENAKDKNDTATATSATNAALPTDKEKFSYAIGMNLAAGLKQQKVDIDPDTLLRGLKDALAGGKTLLTPEEEQLAIVQLQAQIRKAQEDELKRLGEENMKNGADFLAANKTKEGVVALPSGLHYKILTAGTGDKPSATDTVTCNYRGTLLDGSEFDSSYKRGQPASFPLNGVIKGWTEALQLMPVGSKWQLFIPPDLAYGPRGAGGVIGPNATLIFEVELLSIKGKQAAPATPAPSAKP